MNVERIRENLDRVRAHIADAARRSGRPAESVRLVAVTKRNPPEWTRPLVASGAPAGAIRGWANGTCTNQLTTCDFSQDRPWSPDAPLPPE